VSTPENHVMTTNLAPLILVTKQLDVSTNWMLKTAVTFQSAILMLTANNGVFKRTFKTNAKKLFAISKEEFVSLRSLAKHAIFLLVKRCANQKMLVKLPNVFLPMTEQVLFAEEPQSSVMIKKLALLINAILFLDNAPSNMLLTMFVALDANVTTMLIAKIMNKELVWLINASRLFVILLWALVSKFLQTNNAK
jgi:hypothetical protein